MCGSTSVKKRIKKMKCVTFLSSIMLSIFMSKSYAEMTIKSLVKPTFSSQNQLHLNSNLKMNFDLKNRVKFTTTLLSLNTHVGAKVLPEYAVSVQDDDFGKITIGAHKSSSDLLLVDGGSFVTSFDDMFGDSYLHSGSLVRQENLMPYDFKISYAASHQPCYFATSYAPVSNIRQMRVLYADSLNATTDLKTSIGFTNENVSAGLNLKYLGFLIGGSIGSNSLYTAGIGYSIGPFNTSLTYLHTQQISSQILTAQYQFRKNISPFIQFISDEQTTLLFGIRFVL